MDLNCIISISHGLTGGAKLVSKMAPSLPWTDAACLFALKILLHF